MSLEGKGRAIDISQELSRLLCREDEFACTLRITYGNSCLARAHQAVTSKGTPVAFAHAEGYVNMCESCLAYWLSLRLCEAIFMLA